MAYSIGAGACWSLLLTQRGKKDGSLQKLTTMTVPGSHWVPGPCLGCYTVLHYLHSNSMMLFALPVPKKNSQVLCALQNQSHFRCLKAGSIQLCTSRNKPALSSQGPFWRNPPTQNTKKRLSNFAKATVVEVLARDP